MEDSFSNGANCEEVVMLDQSVHTSTDEDDESENEALNGTGDTDQSGCSKWLHRNETPVRCFHVRDMHVSCCNVVAISSDKGVHIFIPRYLSLEFVRNAIYRQLLLPGPWFELRELLANKVTNSYTNLAPFSNLTLIRRVRWAPSAIHIAALSNEGQLIVTKVDLSCNSSESFASCNISQTLLEKLTIIPIIRPTFANNSVVKNSCDYGDISHFAWVERPLKSFEMHRTLELIVVNKKLDLVMMILDCDLKTTKTIHYSQLKLSPSMILAVSFEDSDPETSQTKVVIGYTNGSIDVITLNKHLVMANSRSINADAMIDHAPISCGTFWVAGKLAIVAKFNRLIFVPIDENDEKFTESVYEYELPESYFIYRIKISGDRLIYFTKTGVSGFCDLPINFYELVANSTLQEELSNLLKREQIVVESKFSKYIMGSRPQQNLCAIDTSENFEFLFYVYEDGFVPKREKRDFKLVCLSTYSEKGKFSSSSESLNCLNSDIIFNELWFTNTFNLDPNSFSQKYWPNKALMVSNLAGFKFNIESIAGKCSLCSKNVATLAPNLIGYCNEAHDWPVCSKGHVISKPRDIVLCLMCRMQYCTEHKPFLCSFCVMPLF